MRAAIYLRVSTEDQARHGYSLPSQREACAERARELGADEIVEFCDEGVSGEILIRPGITALREAAAKGEIDLVVCYDPDRFSRNLAHQLILTEEFEKAGARLEFVNFEWQNTPDGRLFYAMRGAIAEYEKEKIKERTLRGKIQKARLGGIPSSFKTYGYLFENGQPKPHPEEAEVVREIYRWFTTEDIGFNTVARRLTERGIPTKLGKTEWRPCVVRRILTNPVYMGVFIYNRLDTKNKVYNKFLPKEKRYKVKLKPESEWIKVPVPAIVSEETWLKAHEKAQAIRRLHAGFSFQRYLLSGIISCADCGNTMTGFTKRNRKGEHTKRGYRCVKTQQGYTNTGCRPMKAVDADTVERIVWEQVCSWLSDPDALVRELQESTNERELRADLDRINKLIADVERGRENVLNALASGLFNLDAKTKKALTDLKEREKRLLARKKEIEAAVNKSKDAKNKIWEIRLKAKEFLDKLDDLTFEQKQQLIRTLVKQIVISGRGEDMRVTVFAAFAPEVQIVTQSNEKGR